MPLDSPILDPATTIPPLPYDLARFAPGLLASPDITADQLESTADFCRRLAAAQVAPSGGVSAHWLIVADLLSAFVPVRRAMEPARRGGDAR